MLPPAHDYTRVFVRSGSSAVQKSGHGVLREWVGPQTSKRDGQAVVIDHKALVLIRKAIELGHDGGESVDGFLIGTQHIKHKTYHVESHIADISFLPRHIVGNSLEAYWRVCETRYHEKSILSVIGIIRLRPVQGAYFLSQRDINMFNQARERVKRTFNRRDDFARALVHIAVDSGSNPRFGLWSELGIARASDIGQFSPTAYGPFKLHIGYIVAGRDENDIAEARALSHQYYVTLNHPVVE